ncbi:hypothetical protein SCOCK_80220 [Actinacidiphila cocklensis]|uniref:Uncharacterized protein n=1 Tax=Actinacidiphila cocklensis TaxID=887465 RepID=A0A9W4E4M3_9ACTN|nr:hypothetical protein SCOCK_80220 [Actinacidiphila cocklensis]
MADGALAAGKARLPAPLTAVRAALRAVAWPRGRRDRFCLILPLWPGSARSHTGPVVSGSCPEGVPPRCPARMSHGGTTA